MNDQPLLILALLVGCAVLSFLLSGMEAGVLALSPLRIRQLRRAGNARAEVLHGFLQRPEDFLWTIFVGNTICNFVVFCITVLFLLEWHKGEWIAARIAIFAGIVFLFYVLCELLPKMLFRLYPNRICLWLASPFRVLHVLLRPIVALATWLSHGLLRWTGGKRFVGNLFGSREELRFIMQESAAALTSEEKIMINRVLDLQNIALRQITIPFIQATVVQTDTLMAEVLRLANEKKRTRFPVFKDRRVIGIITLKGFLYSNDLAPDKTAGDFVKPALFLPENMRLEDALQRLRRSGQRMAIVLGRDQREIGIVTLQDILRTIFGEVTL